MKIAFVFFLLLVSCSSNHPTQNTYDDTRKLLSEPIIPKENFIKLFQIGDERVDDLIRALNDKDKIVRDNAHRIIRYIDNPRATKAMYEWLSQNALKEKEFPTGPIPIPINDWEYQFDSKSYMYSTRSYLKESYALFLDNSDKAQSVLNQFIEQENKNPYDYLRTAKKLEKLRELNMSQEFQENGDLAEAILQTPFFQHRTDDLNQKTNLEKLKSNLITFNNNKTRALINVQNEDGTLEVVVEKVEDGWKFYSIIRLTVY